MQRLLILTVELRRGLEEAAAELPEPRESAEVSALVKEREELRCLVSEMEELVGEIEASGGQFKGMDLGLVDFPAVIDGQDGLMCWQYGEKEVTHWHPAEAGFAGRQALSSTVRKTLLQ